ncbi:MAG: SDR family NAD(P)-dependent oxidoreductase [bacterium]|nr:SDR family NAD(P)-dependent oxidoreductase [bacterium]
MAEILIWGASGGIGGALVTQCAAQGWTVYAAARHDDRIPAGAALTCAFRAEDAYSIQQAAYQVGQASSGLDAVVYAAGGMVAGTLDSFSAGDWAAVFDANLNGAARCAAASLPLMKEGGHFLAIGAYVDKISLPRFGAYAAAKAALEPLITILGKENRKLRFTLVRPGAVDTPFWHNVPFSLPKGAASAESVAAAILQRVESGQSGALDL